MGATGKNDRVWAAAIAPEATGFVIVGTFTDDTLAGDALSEGGSGIALSAMLGNGAGSVPGSDDGRLEDFGQSLFGLAGNDSLAGDALAAAGGTIALDVRIGNSDAVVGGSGGNDNDARAFEDRLSGSIGSDRMAGDVLAAGSEVRLNLTAAGGRWFTAGGDRNRILAWNDTLQGGRGADAVAGDVSTTGAEPISIEVSLAGAARSYVADDDGRLNWLEACADRLSGGDGRDMLVGDVHHAGGESRIELAVDVGRGGRSGYYYEGPGGTLNTALSFEDSLFGQSGDDLIVGDVSCRNDTGRIVLHVSAGAGGDGYYGQYGGDFNSALAFGDHLRGGSGFDTLAGDVSMLGGARDLHLSMSAGSPGKGARGSESFVGGGDGGHSNVVFAGNDRLDGVGDDDLVVGDVFRERSEGTLSMVSLAGAGESVDEAFGGEGGDRNTTRSCEDTISGGNGADMLVGDVFSRTSPGSINLRAASGTGIAGESYYLSGGNGGTLNFVSMANDRFSFGPGADTVIGDVSAHGMADVAKVIVLTADAGSGSDAGPGTGGEGGDRNHTIAFGDSSSARSKFSIGDVECVDSSGAVLLSALAGQGGSNAIDRFGYTSSGGSGGSDNSTYAFNDNLGDRSSGSTLIGDIDLRNSTASVHLVAAAGNGGDIRANPDAVPGYGGDNNTVQAFCDFLMSYGETGGFVLVGDLRAQGSSGTITLDVRVGAGGKADDGTALGNGGHGNFVEAFNDTLLGKLFHSGGGDLMVGDLLLEGGEAVTIRIEGGADDTISAFQDSIDAGSGDDVLYGDFYVQQPANAPAVEIVGNFSGRDLLFADALEGDEGDDILFGQLGKDSLNGGWDADTLHGGEGSDNLDGGGGGSDTFVYSEGDVSSSGQPAAVDSIFSFDTDDIIDVRSLLPTDFTGVLADYLDFRTKAGDTVVAIDLDGSNTGSGFTDFLRMEDFVFDQNLEELVAAGLILVA